MFLTLTVGSANAPPASTVKSPMHTEMLGDYCYQRWSLTIAAQFHT